MYSMETHRTEREQRDATRKAAWDSAARNEGTNRNIQGMGGAAKKGTLADRAKVRWQSWYLDLTNAPQYQFEADSEDDEMENEIVSQALNLLQYLLELTPYRTATWISSMVRLSASTPSAALWAKKWRRRTSISTVSLERRTRLMTR
jgi:hypothetical protein